MQTLKIELEDGVYQNIVHSGIDIQEKVKEFLFDLVDDGYPAITTQEAKKRVSDAVKRYEKNPESFTELTSKDWDDIETRLIKRHS
jgi:polyhydroxyalkanoate synthesis regulator phasin